jgi:hypothetical protein
VKEGKKEGRKIIEHILCAMYYAIACSIHRDKAYTTCDCGVAYNIPLFLLYLQYTFIPEIDMEPYLSSS